MKWLIFGLLFILPLVVFPSKFGWFEGPKVVLAEILIEILLLWQLFKKGNPFKNINPIHLGILTILFVLSLIHLIIQSNFNALFGNVFRFSGILLLWHLLIFSLIVSLIPKLNIPKFLPFLALMGLFISTFLFGTNAAGRNVGSLGEPNALAATSVFLLTFVYFCNKHLASKILGLLITIYIILVSQSQSAVLALAIEIIFLSLYKFLKLSLFKSLVVSLLILATSYYLPFLIGGGWYENRSEVWETALIAGAFSPVFGSGFGNIQDTLHKTSLILNNNIQYQIVDSSHNLFLDFWVQGGIIGLISIIILILLSISNLIKRREYLNLTCLLGILTIMSFNPVSVVILIYFWFLMGQGFSKHSD